MKKIILSFILFSVFAYVLAYAWAINWIDTQSIKRDFFSKNQNNKIKTLNIAKKIWQITPAFDKEKDAERAFKISELYLSSLSIYSDKEEMIRILKDDYQFIKKYKKDISITYKITLINRSLGKIEDKKFKDFLLNSVPKPNLSMEPDIMIIQFGSYIEKGWFDYFHDYKHNMEWRMAQTILGAVAEIKSNNAFLILDDYHSGLKLCYDKYLSHENAEEHNLESQKIFQQIQKKLTVSGQEYKVLYNHLNGYDSKALMMTPLISSNQTECEKEVKNFADKMVELANN